MAVRHTLLWRQRALRGENMENRPENTKNDENLPIVSQKIFIQGGVGGSFWYFYRIKIE